MKINYSPEAVDDLHRLREFIETKNPDAAHKAASIILKGVNQLKSFPFLGSEVISAPDPKSIRDLVIGNYLIRYLVHAKEIYILRIWHQKENWP